MHWPFRRDRGRSAPTPARDTAAHAPLAARRPTPPPAVNDWAHLAPISTATPRHAPLTFHGERFGRNVAGARVMAASLRDRPAPSGHVAPSGILLDATAIESLRVESLRVDGPTVQPADVVAPSRPPVHRAHRPARTALTTADAEVGFAPPPERDRSSIGADRAMSWTAETGFADPPAPADTATGEPALRYVAVAGTERPPADLVHLVAERTGVQVHDAVIDRSAATSERAARLGAIAFTEHATVHLPSELGAIDQPAVRAVVAHELTHVAQQRRGSTLPHEGSPAGRELEDEAQDVQHAAAPGVRPHFLRRHPGPTAPAAGVQRLADDDPYAWQDRDRDPSPARAVEQLGFGAIGVVAGALGRHRDEGGERGWAQDFEHRHADRLERLRRRRYDELRDEAARELRNDALRRDEAPGSLDRDAIIDIRRRLDDEMPWEFGPPDPEHAYPEPLPRSQEERDEHDVHAGRDDARGHAGNGAAAPAGRHRDDAPAGPSPRRLRSTGSASSRPTSRRSASHGRRGGDEAFDWQHREPTDQGVVTALFGGGLLGDLIGRAVGPETADDRAEAEAAAPRLHERRQDRERELRHARLIEKRTEQLRTADTGSEDGSDGDAQPRHERIALTRDDITRIREQVDADMPLQYVAPQYLDAHDDVVLDSAGRFTDGELAEDAAPASPSRTSPTSPTSPTAPAPTAGTPSGAADAPGAPAGSTAAATTAAEPRGGADVAAVAAGAAIGHAAQAPHRADAHPTPIAPDEHAGHADTARLALAHASELDIDLLSRRVWQRIRRELRSELIVDRERAGVLADAR